MLEKEDHKQDAAFNQAMHGKDSSGAQKLAVDEYSKYWDNKTAAKETEDIRAQRRTEYATLTRHYHNLSTDPYEYGWVQSFHFCRFSVGESFRRAIARHEHFLAHVTDIRENAVVLDVGCGVGGPAKEIAKFSGARVVGLNNNNYQIDRATLHWNGKAQMPLTEDSFDAVYAIEATVHAPALHSVYSEIFRVLKHKRYSQIRLHVEEGNGVSSMEKMSVNPQFNGDGSFEMLHHEDLAERPSSIHIWDFPTIFRITGLCRTIVHRFVGAMEALSLAPKGSQKAGDSMARGGDALVAGGREKLFTPICLIVRKKPSKTAEDLES
ncbi:putative sterol 24-c-methyltransferase [Zopfia rhizophila CBS 207.26]|uniref:Sterol 24-C-methyltransferase n=1 Tax=Zopfia rhizophila CBS 207.26 TaxID=1314779 RepID=A0A6A6DCS5_9PEZI|nr:putative sterol 24-c-methyltransferase [Zopfia rhizophila CBS 207.26]